MNQTEPLLVDTALGRLRGEHANDCLVWKGIPFAQPPTGEHRFREPQPPQPWVGVREARAFGPVCPQAFGGKAKPRVAAPEYSEDCLYLNVWSPALDGVRRPVALWIYGGAFCVGSANGYDAAHLARSGDIVVVTANYRTGPFGFVNFGSLPGARELDDNVGLRDQIATLEWIRDHIEAFGGDPQRVTIMGESAGSISVALLLQSARAQPLFHGAIMESGATTLIHDREMSERLARLYVDELGLGTEPRKQLQAVPPLALLLAQQKLARRFPKTLPAAPWFDGQLLADSPGQSLTTHSAPVPLLAGHTRDETRTFEILPGPASMPLTRAEVARLLYAQLGESPAEQILHAYPEDRSGRRQLSTDATFALPTVHFAERHSTHSATWLYRFDCRHPLFGAMHGLDLLYLWNMRGPLAALARGGMLRGRRAALAERMRRHWAEFVRTGSPGTDWPPFDTRDRRTKLFNLQDQVVADPDKARREAWASHDIFIGLDSANVDEGATDPGQ
jgi:para-nitrobenzyl esterase